MKHFKLGCLAAACAFAVSGYAQEAPAAVSAQDVLNILIEKGVVDEGRVNEILNRAKERTRRQYQTGVETVPAGQADRPAAQDGSVVRVPYVPQYIRDDIREKVRMELREEVVADVMKKAKDERWGLPGTAPDWTERVKFSGDIRLRAESIMFADSNEPLSYENYNAINKAGGTVAAGQKAYYNTTEDRERLRARARFGLKAKVTQGMEAGVRLATGNPSNPVSTNETLGDYGQSFELQMDRAYLKFKTFANDFQLVGGRFENPFMRTDLIWDNDLQFDGVAASYYFLRSSSWEDQDRQWDPFVTAGIFPVDEYEISTDDKWLLGIQLGTEYHSWEQDVFRVAVGYYHYTNMPAEKNPVSDNRRYDFMAPDSFQKGNTVFNIHNNPSSTDDQLFGLAFDYHLVNFLVEYDLAMFSPYHVVLTAEYVKNIGADEDEALARAFPGMIPDAYARDVAGWSKDGFILKALFGWPIMAKPDDWQVALSYRELGADAVIDAFADSDFNLGGTDARGYVFEASYGLMNEVWATGKLMSSNSIDGFDFGVDIVQIDINARF